MARKAIIGKRASAVIVLCALFALGSPAQTFTTLFSFGHGGDGEYPYAGLVQGANGDLFGTTNNNGESIYGNTLFQISTGGTLTTLYDFCSATNSAVGCDPWGSLLQAANGDLYGTTLAGGTNNKGTVFRSTLGGTTRTLYSFCSLPSCADGSSPYGALAQGASGDLYGMTNIGGAHAGPIGRGGGTVFKITPSGTLTTLYSFCSLPNCADGEYPNGALVLATNGDVYGTTYEGGTGAKCTESYGCGTVFQITPNGTVTTVYSFCSLANCADGLAPQSGLIQAGDGNLYGTTDFGGANCQSDEGCGTIFKLATGGTLKTIYSFCSLTNCADGAEPYAGLVRATDGNLYGTTFSGGISGNGTPGQGYGTIFQITPGGGLTTLYSFCSLADCADGKMPYFGLIQATNGDFYGTTPQGGGDSDDPVGFGTVFSISLGLGPFVESLPAAGKAGGAVKILGTLLNGATSVTFNGAAAVFTVASPTLITTTVPTGATSGNIQVVTPSGTLSSNVPFRLLP